MRAHVQDQIHADQYVEQEVAVEQPISCERRKRLQTGVSFSLRDTLRESYRIIVVDNKRQLSYIYR